MHRHPEEAPRPKDIMGSFSTLRMAEHSITILHDNLIIGGTKRRALHRLLKTIPSEHIFYAGTTMGHGALALAHACQDNDKVAEIFMCARGDENILQKLKKTNAVLHLRPPLPISVLHDMAQDAAQKQGGLCLPPAFNMPEFQDALVAALKDFGTSPYSEIWTCAVTGTLTRALQRAFPDMPFKTVKVVKAECDLGRSEVFDAPEKYHIVAKSPPPYPSCPYTDAKIWQFLENHAKPDALIWNTAG